MAWLARELRLGARLLAREKAFSLAAALTLALCMGANAALFSVVHNILLRPLPFPESDRVVLMANAYPKAGAGDPSNSGVPDYFDRLRETSVFEEQALFNHASVSVDQEGTPARLDALNVTPSFFRLLRVAPALGRTSVILAEGYEMRPGESVISPAAANVSSGYFEAIGARLAQGRFFDDRDVAKAPRVIIVDQKLARRFWPGQDPIGRRMYFPNDINNLTQITDKTVFLTVVGVVEDLKLHDLTEGEQAWARTSSPRPRTTRTS